MLTDKQRLSEIGIRAARLCFASGCPADNVCVTSCAAVCPGIEYLKAASDAVFSEYWANHPTLATEDTDAPFA